MASLAGNKAFAATLVAGFVLMVAGFVVDVLVHPAAKPTMAQGPAEPVTALAKPVIPSILPLLAQADVGHGQSVVAQECGACHSFEKGAPVMVGPSLYGVVGARVAGSAGYSYSAALKTLGGTWTYERLNHWLFDPEAFAPGTLMSYGGLPGIQTRADVVAYLRTLADKPLPLPAANP